MYGVFFYGAPQKHPLEGLFLVVILVCTDYVTKWVEAKALSFSNENVVVSFLFEDIFTRFGVLREIVTNQGSQFTSKVV